MKSLLIAILLAATLVAQERPRDKMPVYRAKSTTGESLDNTAVEGKPVLIQLWATWCGYCRKDQPIVEKLSKEFADKGLVILAVNVGEPRDKVNAYLKENPRPGVKMVFSEDSNLAPMIQPQGFPFYVLLDKEGRIAGAQAGSGGEPTLRNLLTKVGLENK